MIASRLLDAALRQVSEGIVGRQDRPGPAVVGLCGAQGSGKTTLARAMAQRLDEVGFPALVLSLDDFYLPLAARLVLAEEVHPLLATRGVPGTHDLELLARTLAALDRGEPVGLPVFDKASDDRVPAALWRRVEEPVAVVLFEGWCVGAAAPPRETLGRAVNALEREEDPDGIWRSYVQAMLETRYQALFARLERLILLAAPAFEVVERWRGEQEEAIRGTGGAGVMDAAGIARFVAHYERLTRWILTEMPERADLVVELDEARRPFAIRARPTG